MQVAVAHVAEDADAQPVALGQVLDKAGPWRPVRCGGTVTSSRMVVGATRGQSGEGGTPRGGEPRRLLGGLGDAHVDGTVFTREPRHDLGLLLDHGGMAVGFHQQHRLGLAGQADLGVVLHAIDRGVVEEL